MEKAFLWSLKCHSLLKATSLAVLNGTALREVPRLFPLVYLFMDVKAYTLFGTKQGLYTACRKEYTGRRGYWLKAQHYLDTLLAWRRTLDVRLCD